MTFFFTLFTLFILFILFTLAQRKFKTLQLLIENQQARLDKQGQYISYIEENELENLQVQADTQQSQIDETQAQLIKQEKYISELKAQCNICLKLDMDAIRSLYDELTRDTHDNLMKIVNLKVEVDQLESYVDKIESLIELNSLSRELFDNPSFLSGLQNQVDKYTSHYMREDETQSLIDDAIRNCSVEVDSIELSLYQHHE